MSIKPSIDWDIYESIIRLGECQLSRDMYETHSKIMFLQGKSESLAESAENRDK